MYHVNSGGTICHSHSEYIASASDIYCKENTNQAANLLLLGEEVKRIKPNNNKIEDLHVVVIFRLITPSCLSYSFMKTP